MLTRRPGFTAVVVLTIALGVGANSVIFSAVNAILLRPLPYKNPEQLAVIWETNPQVNVGVDNLPVSSPDFFDFRNQSQSFDGIVAFRAQGFNLSTGGDPERVDGTRISAEFFQVLGIQLVSGRSFTQADDNPGAEPVAIVSQGLWRRRFGSDPDLLGKSVTLNGKNHTVVGIAPSDITFLNRKADIWVPVALNPNNIVNRGARNLLVVGRLKQGVTIEQARSEMAVIARNLEQQYPEDNSGWGVNLASLYDEEVGGIQQPLWALFGAVILVLLIACANVANLLLARSASRQKEIAIRIAVGATRWRLIRQLLTESALLALIGGALAVVLANLGIGLLVSLSPAELPRVREIRLDGGVIVFTLVVSLLTGLIFGLVPALQGSRPDINEALKEGSRGSKSDIRTNPTKALLVIVDFALAMILIIGAGLLIKSLRRLADVEPGFKSANVMTFKISLSANKYPKPDQQTRYFQQVIERLDALPQVERVGASSILPLTPMQRAVSFFVEGRPRVINPDNLPIASYRMISPDYFDTLGISLVDGRQFSEYDKADSAKVIIINETLARTFWPGENPIGARVNLEDAVDENNKPVFHQIVGIVKDIKHFGLDSDAKAEMFVPYTQSPSPQMNLVVKTATDPEAIVGDLRREVLAVDREQPLFDLRSMDDVLYESVWKQRFSMVLLNIFALVALVLSAVGIYGVMAYQVAQRTREIGIRMALGARPLQILKLVLGRATVLSVIGVLIGGAGAFAFTRVLEGLLYNVSMTDPATFALTALLLVGVGVIASYIPARRALRIEPTIALKSE
jgi:putative ABC transport system permease protein